MNSKKVISVALPVILILAAVLYGFLAGNVKTNHPQIVVFGDSLIGNDRTETSVTALLEKSTGLRVFNGGIGGSLLSAGSSNESYWNCYNMVNIAECMANNNYEAMLANIPYDYLEYNVLLQYLPETVKGISKIRFDAVEYIVIEQGINDCIGRVSEEEFEAALRSVTEDVRKASKKAKIIVVSPGYTSVIENENPGATSKYVEIERKVCSEQNITFIDFYNNGGINATNCEEYLYDGLHTNGAGNEILARMIKSEID